MRHPRPDASKVGLLPSYRAHTVWTDYEYRSFHYAWWWAISQQQAPRIATTFVDRVDRFENIIHVDDAAYWRSVMDADIESLACDIDLRMSFLDAVIPELDAEISTYFLSEYMPMFLRFYINKPDDDLPYAAKWHCDAGPRKHLKLLLYLTDTVETGGNTEFLDYDTTMRLDECGYLFCDLNQRVDDLRPMFGENGFNCIPQSFWLKPSDGILFEPSTIMHRAIWPTKAPRYMAQILFLPSPLPWREACEQFQLPNQSNEWIPIKREE